MNDATRAVRILIFGVVLLLLHAPPVSAQAPAPVERDPEVHWRLLSGVAWSSLRDVAQTGRPLDASPVSWDGRGFRLEMERTRSSASRMHRLTAAVSMAGTFDYRSPLQSTRRPASEYQRTIDGWYEYRRYLLRDRGWTGLDVGIGGRATGQRASFGRSIAGDITAGESVLAGSIGVVVAARVRRWSRFQAEVDWANGLRIAHLRFTHSEIPSRTTSGGGGWTTDFGTTADFRLTPRTRLTVRYSRASVAQYASHRPAFTSGAILAAGVMYAK